MRHWSSLRSVLLLALPLVLGCEDKIKPTVMPGIDSGSLPQQESWNSTVTLSDSGRVRAVIHAGYIRVFENPRETHLSERVRVHFFDDEGHQTSVLTSERGKVDDLTNDLEAIDHVLVVSTDSTELRTDRLFWDNKRQKIHTPDFVYITSPKEKVQGRGFESDHTLRNYRIFHATGEARTE